MTFLNAILLGGAATGAVPLVIHLLHRSRARPVPWGAMQFLRVSAKHNQRRPRLEERLLLILRILVPVILALCMARPVLEQFSGQSGAGGAGGASQLSLVLVIDDTASMAVAREGQRHIDAARAQAIRMVRSLPRGSDVAVVLPSDPESPLITPTLDLQAAAGRLETLGFSASDAPLAAAVHAGVSLGMKMMHAARFVVVISDFQKASWSAGDGAERVRIADRARGLQGAPTIVSLPVGEGEPENLAVESLDFTPLPVPAGRRIQFKAGLRAFGKRGFPSAKVVWKIDGLEHFTDTVRVEAGQRSQSALEFTFDRTGAHRIEVFTDSDTLLGDNQRYAVVRVVDPIPVLLINGEHASEPLQGETDFLEIALSTEAATAKGPRLFDVKVVRPESVTSKDITAANVIVLANVRSAENFQRDLEDRVLSGSGLLVFPGDKLSLPWYRDQAHREGKGWLPVPFGEVKGGAVGAGSTRTIADQKMSHPAFAMFEGKDVFRGGVLRVWQQLAGADDALPEGASVPLRLEDGSPLFVEKNYGDGVAIQAAFAADADWGNFPMRPFYVPMMQQMVAYLASGVMPPLNLRTGQPLAIATAGDPAKRFDKRHTPGMSAADPAGTREEILPARRGARWVGFSRPRQMPGFHMGTVDGGETVFYAVNGSARESDPERLGPEQIGAVTAEMGGEVVENAAAFTAVARRSSVGMELWKPALGLLLVLLFAELFLLRRFEVRKEAAR
jgi:hypothetical protein